MPDPMLIGMAAGFIAIVGGALLWLVFGPVAAYQDWKWARSRGRCNGLIKTPRGTYQRCRAIMYEDRCPATNQSSVAFQPHVNPQEGTRIEMADHDRQTLIQCLGWFLAVAAIIAFVAWVS